VRSAREDDLEVLRQFGAPAFAYSGATPHLLPFVHAARIVDLYAGLPASAGAYFRDNSRVAPYNLFARPKTLLAGARGASTASDIGFRFGRCRLRARQADGLVQRGLLRGGVQLQLVGQARALARFDGRQPAKDTTGGQLSAPTIVIQYTTVRTSRFLSTARRPRTRKASGTAPRSCSATARPTPSAGPGQTATGALRSPRKKASG